MADRGLSGGDQPSGTAKEGGRVLPPSRRPDGTLRKEVRLRPGYVPPDEVAVYVSKGARWKKEVQSLKEVPPGYDPDVVDVKSKSKSAKRNERKKEKRQQAAVDNGMKLEQHQEEAADTTRGPVSVELLASQMNGVAIGDVSSGVAPSSNTTECSNPSDQAQDIGKKIRALKKKIRLAEAQQQQDMKQDQELEKMAKLEGWRKELKLLEDRNAEGVTL